MSSYQKLKAKVRDLEANNNFYRDALKALIHDPNGVAAQEIKWISHQNRAIDNQLLMGSSHPKNFTIKNTETK